jgi:hypothetical protein
MCKVSVLQSIGVLLTFHTEEPTVLLSVANANEVRKKINKSNNLKINESV